MTDATRRMFHGADSDIEQQLVFATSSEGITVAEECAIGLERLFAH